MRATMELANNGQARVAVWRGGDDDRLMIHRLAPFSHRFLSSKSFPFLNACSLTCIGAAE